MIQPFTPTTVMVAILKIYPAAVEAPEIVRRAAGRIFLNSDAASLSTAVSQGDLAERAGLFLRRQGAERLLRQGSKPTRISERARKNIAEGLTERYPMFHTFTDSLEEVTLHAFEAWHRDGRRGVIAESCLEEGMLAYHHEIRYCSYLHSLLKRSALSV